MIYHIVYGSNGRVIINVPLRKKGNTLMFAFDILSRIPNPLYMHHSSAMICKKRHYTVFYVFVLVLCHVTLVLEIIISVLVDQS